LKKRDSGTLSPGLDETTACFRGPAEKNNILSRTANSKNCETGGNGKNLRNGTRKNRWGSAIMAPRSKKTENSLPEEGARKKTGSCARSGTSTKRKKKGSGQKDLEGPNQKKASKRGTAVRDKQSVRVLSNKGILVPSFDG